MATKRPLTVDAGRIKELSAADELGVSLGQLSDVTVTAPAADQVLKWNGTQWVNGAGAAAANGIPTGGTTGQVLAKVDGTDYSTTWVSVPAPKVTTSSTTSSTHSIDWSASDVIRLTLNHSITSFTITGAQDGQKMILEVIQDGTGSRTITWPAAVRFGTDITSITLSTAAGKKDRIGLIYDGTASKYDVIAVVKGF